MARSKKSTKNLQKSSISNQKLTKKQDDFQLQSNNKGKSHHRQLQFLSQELDVDLEVILEDGEEDQEESVEERSEQEEPVLIQITKDDVAGEIKYWSTSVVCYVFGANPPSSVLTGFINRVWQAQGVDKISFMPNGITKEQQQFVLNNGHLLFDNKPVIIKEWSPEMQLVKHYVKRIPLWIKLFDLDVKFWGTEYLKKICSGVGKFIKCDDATFHRNFLGFAKIMIEVDLDQTFSSVIKFVDETGKTQTLRIVYDWLPLKFTQCKGLGHLATDCRKGKVDKHVVKKMWRPKGVGGAKPVPVNQPPKNVSVQRSNQKTHVHNLVPSTPTVPATVMTPVMVANTPIVESSLPRHFISRLMRNEDGGKRFTTGGVTFMEALSNSMHKARMDLIEYRNMEKGESSKSLTEHGLHKGGRIWLIWDPNAFEVEVYDVTVQSIHTKVLDKARRKLFWFTVVFGLNKQAERIPLWDSLRHYCKNVRGPWLVGGDFNAIMASNERIGEAIITHVEMAPLAQVVQDCQLEDLEARGSFYTWTNKHEYYTKVYSGLDRVLVNVEWVHMFPDSYVHYLPEGLFDHCPGLVHFAGEIHRRGTPFKYFNMWSLAPEYDSIVRNGWSKEWTGTPMFRIVQKLKGLKADLRKLNKEHFGDIENLTHITEIALHQF
ncbi:uncharacterized protein LOC141632962 [Silene latifolia]|uniref:uncharacterized protein LOC141632962 n=1 Tax=Silene latifolia TaxID=37657 RepID=UPI003D776F13